MNDADAGVELLRRLAGGKLLRMADVPDLRGALADAEQRRMLADHGVVIDGTGDDARLQIPGGLDVLRADAIREGLRARGHRPGELEVHWSIDSTNTELLARARLGSIDRAVLIAEHQRAGRGRRGRTWMSPVACNLYISIGAAFARLEDTQALSLCVGVALADALGDLGYPGIGIKWPNDLQIAGRKLSGILIESGGITPRGVQMVIGIGVNVRVPGYAGEAIDQPWIDLAEAGAALPAAQRPDRSRLCASIVGHVFTMLDGLQRGERDAWLARFAEYDVARDQPVTLKLPDRDVQGIARGIDAGGELRVEIDGAVRAFSAGEVSLRVR